MLEAFLICALSVRPMSWDGSPKIVAWQMVKSEQEKLEDWLKKGGAEEVFIHERPQEDKLRDHSWEKVPFTWRGKKIFIRRKPATDQKQHRNILEAA